MLPQVSWPISRKLWCTVLVMILGKNLLDYPYIKSFVRYFEKGCVGRIDELFIPNRRFCYHDKSIIMALVSTTLPSTPIDKILSYFGFE
jgi:hypothetical protein